MKYYVFAGDHGAVLSSSMIKFEPCDSLEQATLEADSILGDYDVVRVFGSDDPSGNVFTEGYAKSGDKWLPVYPT
jgi:hypothetical protein